MNMCIEIIKRILKSNKFWICAFLTIFVFLCIVGVTKEKQIRNLETKIIELEKQTEYLTKLEWENWDELWYTMELYINGDLEIINANQ